MFSSRFGNYGRMSKNLEFLLLFWLRTEAEDDFTISASSETNDLKTAKVGTWEFFSMLPANRSQRVCMLGGNLRRFLAIFSKLFKSEK